MHSIEKRRHRWIGNLLRHDSPLLTTFEGEILGRTQKGQKRRTFLTVCASLLVSVRMVRQRGKQRTGKSGE